MAFSINKIFKKRPVINSVKRFARIKKTCIHRDVLNRIIYSCNQYIHIDGVRFFLSKLIFCCPFTFLYMVTKNYEIFIALQTKRLAGNLISLQCHHSCFQCWNQHSSHKLLRETSTFRHSMYDNCHLYRRCDVYLNCSDIKAS